MNSELSSTQISELKKTLQQRLTELLEEVRHELLKYDDEQYIKLAGRVHDRQDESVADLLVDLNLAEVDRDIEEIRDIEAALLRIGTNSYGVCIDCDTDINLQRLQAAPSAKRCHECQTRYEQSHIQGQHVSL